MLKVWWVSVKSGFGESLRISCALGTSSAQTSQALEHTAQHALGELTQLRVEKMEELCRCHWDWNLWWLILPDLWACLHTPHSWLPLKKHPLSYLCGVFFVNKREHGKETQPGTCFGIFLLASPFSSGMRWVVPAAPVPLKPAELPSVRLAGTVCLCTSICV